MALPLVCDCVRVWFRVCGCNLYWRVCVRWVRACDCVCVRAVLSLSEGSPHLRQSPDVSTRPDLCVPPASVSSVRLSVLLPAFYNRPASHAQ